METNTTYFTTTGSVRGGCGHHHKTLATAHTCAQRDQRACASLGGGAYSDRRVTKIVDGAEQDLSQREQDNLLGWEER